MCELRLLLLSNWTIIGKIAKLSVSFVKLLRFKVSFVTNLFLPEVQETQQKLKLKRIFIFHKNYQEYLLIVVHENLFLRKCVCTLFPLQTSSILVPCFSKPNMLIFWHNRVHTIILKIFHSIEELINSAMNANHLHDGYFHKKLHSSKSSFMIFFNSYF